MSLYGIDMLIGYVPKNIASHNAAWAHLWKEQLEFQDFYTDIINRSSNIHGYESIYIYHGINFTGSLNLFGGVKDEDVIKLENLIKFKGTIVSIDHDMPDIGAMLKTRIGNKSSSKLLTEEFCDKLSERLSSVEKITQQENVYDYYSGQLCFGDSHSFSAAPHMGYACDRNDGLTLNRIIKNGISSYIDKYQDLKSLTIYAGNIDVRHHLLRYGKPRDVVKDLLEKYETELLTIANKIPEIELVHLLPPEDPSRKLPKTGYYKDTPFYGSIDDRIECVRLFNVGLDNIARRYNFKVFTWPRYWYKIHPVDFFEYMEKPKSVHLSREFYRWSIKDDPF